MASFDACAEGVPESGVHDSEDADGSLSGSKGRLPDGKAASTRVTPDQRYSALIDPKLPASSDTVHSVMSIDAE